MARLADIVVDCGHPASLARFWAAALDGDSIAPYDRVESDRLAALGVHDPEDDPTVLVESDRGPRIWFQCDLESKVVKNCLHLDLATDDAEADVARLLALGATRAASQPDADLIVMLDPELNEFCITRS
jgi:hypothetical protein